MVVGRGVRLVMGHLTVVVSATGRMMVVTLRGRLGLNLALRSRPCAVHSNGHRAPNGEQQGKQQQQVDAQILHGS